MKRTLLPLALLFMACGGSIPPPNERLAQAEAAVRAADELGAKDIPQAALHLKYATDQIDEAKKNMAAEENERASGVLARANADAELAVMLAKEDKSKKEAEKAKDKLKSFAGGGR